jgi:hypothetical protein
MTRPPLTRRQKGARQAKGTRSAQAASRITRACANCRHEVMRRTEHEWSMGGTFFTHTPMCGRPSAAGGGALVHTHLVRSARGACGPAGVLFEPNEKTGETNA